MLELLMSEQPFANQKISVILRFHDPAKLSLLHEAIESLAAQSYDLIEPLVMIQNGNSDTVQAVQELFSMVNWGHRPSARVVPVAVPATIDGRTRLLNAGLSLASGRYLAFLDYDDVLLPEAYATLFNRLKKSQAAVAVGGCRLLTVAQSKTFVSFDISTVDAGKPLNGGVHQFKESLACISCGL